MGLIKSADAASAARPFSMKDVEDHARALIARAQQQAERLLAAAQAEAEQFKAAARAQGYAEGLAQGREAGRQEGLKAGRDQALAEQRNQLATLFNTLTVAATQLDASRRQLEAQAVRDVLELAIAIAQRVTKRQGQIDPQVAVANTQEAIKLVCHASDVRIAIHPSCRAALRDAMPRLQLQWPGLEHVELVEDAAIAPGGCRIYTAQGQIDGDLDVQLERIVKDLLPEREQAQ